ncbi:PQQ-dependent sugar dehydrogenase [Salsipaludibacter albus]|uniref:PQQ-dependent sugar dehydrogenase n=1 Tax=Salsipaludibacter albus TaxID=2849650 RepID=UPI001EE4887C|nr:PQQ-dependent sugar dehydrogenase [Salsipaludibacter albus]MBY5162719.1 PQQ-dependent sugar dehydrogenase [Salsipaludibacter albus]
MTVDLRRPLVVALAAGLVLACSGDPEPPTASPEPTASASSTDESSPDPAPSPSDPATPGPTGTTTAGPSDSPAASPTDTETEALPPLQGLDLELVAEGLEQPLDVAVRPDDGGLYVVEQPGTVRRIDDGAAADIPLLDVSGEMEIHSIEQGLLGLAFHPDFPDDPRVFAFHSLPSNDNVLVSYEVGADGEQVDPDSRTELLTVDKEPDKVRHNGGKLLFGPDGLLFLSLGDAARASVNGQDPSTLPGTILRLDVDGDEPYAIPAGNPFADGATVDGVSGAPEVYWFGLRNPWRFSIDAQTGLAWIGDVGQETAEEVDVVALDDAGVNFGWPAREGTGTFYDDPAVTEPVDPVLTVAHDDTGQGCSITGGVVARGPSIPELDGTYFYADWCNGWIRSVGWDGEAVTDPQDWSDQLEVGQVSSITADGDGEVLVVDWDAGTVSRIVAVR